MGHVFCSDISDRAERLDSEGAGARVDPRAGRRPVFGYALALVVTAALVAFRLALLDDIAQEPALIIIFVPILLAAYVGGLGCSPPR